MTIKKKPLASHLKGDPLVPAKDEVTFQISWDISGVNLLCCWNLALIELIKHDRAPMRGEEVHIRVAGLGRLSAGAKMAMKPFVKRVITIFATNASFLRVISNFRI